MNTTEIQERVNAIRAAMTAKGLASAAATAMLKSDQNCAIHLSWRDESKEFNSAYKTFHNEDLKVAMDEAGEFVAALPDAETAKLHEFMGALGKVIDLGNKHGIDVEFVNPLVATMKRLSENVITDQRAA